MRAANVNEQCVVEQHAVYFNDSIKTVHVTETDQLNGCCIACGEYTRSVRSRQAGRDVTDVERCNLWTWCDTAWRCCGASACGLHVRSAAKRALCCGHCLHGGAGFPPSLLLAFRELHLHCLLWAHSKPCRFCV